VSAPHPEEKHQSLTDHLRDLRSCLINSFYGIGVALAIAWPFAEDILYFLTAPIEPFVRQGLNITSPVDKFLIQLKISLFSAVLIASPWIFYQLWRFIAPGLYRHERVWALLFVGVGTSLFLLGAAFVYYVVFPFSFDFLLRGIGFDRLEEQINVNSYLSFVVMMIIAFGAIFEMPVVLAFLAKMGMVNAPFLRRFRRYAIVINSVIAAIISPPDALSMMFMLVPMVVLYEVSILVVSFINPAPEAKPTGLV
jgi:sec-independent protein translocase protein TatC